MTASRDCIEVLLWIFLLQITTSNSTLHHGNGNRNTNVKTDCSRYSLRRKWLCDGIPHCFNGSDEENCLGCNSSNAFHCKNKRCIPIYLQCDGYDDCWDGSEEENCSEWTPPTNIYDVPATIHHIDIKDHIVLNFNAEINVHSEFKIPLIAFKAITPNLPLDAKTVIFEHMKKVVLYIHGFATEDLEDGIELKDALFTGADDVDCIIIVDWRKGAFFENIWKPWLFSWIKYYYLAVNENVPLVANRVTSFIQQRIPETVYVHLIGFSLGGQITGIVGRTLQIKSYDSPARTIERISAIDPAGPIYDYSLFSLKENRINTLRNSDAAFVDVIHASKVFGMVSYAGDIDFYIHEKECYLPPCTHSKALEVYIESIRSCSQISCPFNRFINNTCTAGNTYAELSSVGYLANLYIARGEHHVNFYFKSKSDGSIIITGNCSHWLNIDLPAKKRICHKPPSATSVCRLKPYLSECDENCEDDKTVRLVCQKDFETVGCNQVLWAGHKCSRPLACLNEDGNQVQYFVVYKFPDSYDYIKIYRSEDDGLIAKRKQSYQLQDLNENEQIVFEEGFYPIRDKKSILGLTLSPLYEQVDQITYIMWNDDSPYESKNLTNHDIDHSIEPYVVETSSSKGVLAYNDKGGFFCRIPFHDFHPTPTSLGIMDILAVGRGMLKWLCA